MPNPFMLDAWLPFTPSEFRVKFATETWEKQGCKSLRRAVFCQEQSLFGDDDADRIDAYAIPLVAASCVLGAPDEVVGTVRIHEEGPGLWFGSRLAVQPEFRNVGRLGASLIRLAVSSANARGCQTFLAHVQVQNVPLFRKLHWRSQGEVNLHGRSHHLMEAELAYYPPCPDPETGFVTLAKAAS